MPKKNIRLYLTAALLVFSLVFVFKSMLLPGLKGKQTDYSKYKLLGSAISIIKSHYVEEPHAVQTMEGGFKGMIDSLDVLSGYLSKPLMDAYRAQLREPYPEVGLILYKSYGAFPQVIGIREGSPADLKGIRYGDFISVLDGQSTLTMSMREANLLLKDKVKKTVELKVMRSEGTEEILLDRKILFTDNYSFTPLPKFAGILKIHTLHSCVDSIQSTLAPRLKGKTTPLILDLRNCHEGSIPEVQKLVNLFLQANDIGHFSSKNGTDSALSAPREPELPDIPLYIWINRATIDQAEIAAAVLKDMGRARIVGVPSPGLVSRQQPFSFGDGSGILLTTEIFILKSASPLWQKGIQPDEQLSARESKTEDYIKATQTLMLKKS
ncbi:MAG: S41 family peptidase [Acidobacteriota bacterium]